MSRKTAKIKDDLNESAPEDTVLFWAHENIEPATGKGFSFMRTYGDKKGTRNIDYKTAKIYQGSKWHVEYSYFHEGKFHRIKVYEGINRIKDLKEKREFAEDLKKAINFGLSQGYNPFQTELKVAAKTWTLIQSLNFFKQKIPDMGLRDKSKNDYSSQLNTLTRNFSSLHLTPVSEITQAQCKALLSWMKSERKWSNTSYNNYLRFARTVFFFLIANEITTANPFKFIKPLPDQKTKNQPFDNETFELIKKKAEPDLLKFMMFMYDTGTRPNEARQLKYEHILRDRRILYIPAAISKNKKDGYVALSDDFLEIFQGKGLIFGKSRNYYGAKFTALKKKLKLPKECNLYSVKHTRAVRMAKANVSPYDIMMFFRHSSLEMTMVYLRDLGVNISRGAVGNFE
jgi:integrase